MAYSDTRGLRVNPVGLAGASLLNAAVLAGVLLAAPQVVEQGGALITKIFTITPPPPPPAPPIVQTRKQLPPKPGAGPATVPPKVNTSTQTSTNLLTGHSELRFPVTDFGTNSIIIDPVAPPVFNPAKLNMRLTRSLQPEYPPSAVRAGIEGRVSVRVLIGVDGRVKVVEKIDAVDQSLFVATQRHALAAWRFIPASRDGAPVESWHEMTVRFQIPG